MNPATPFQWLTSIFRLHRDPPLWREIPLLLLKCSIWGFLVGPFMAIFFMALSGKNPLLLFQSPAVLLWVACTGVVWALSFYILCGLGSRWVSSLIPGYPPSIVGTILVVYNTIASSLAFAVAITINSRLGGGVVHFEVPFFWQMLVIDGLIGGILALIISAFLKLKLQVERTQHELSRKAIETARAQALALQSQINPHFFFNTLNSISALVDDDPDAAKQMIGRLADMFRYTLGCTHNESVGLDQELQFVRDYLAIEQARFRRRLRVKLPIESVSDIRVPGLILQPLVENAVKHGIARSIEGGTVSIEVERVDGGTRISVRNTADHAAAPATLYKTGHALENIRARLRLFTGRQDPLQIVWNAEVTEFSFEI
jgi:sensor histidine kinase YesM